MALGKVAIIAFLIQIRGPHDPTPWFLWFIGVTSCLANFTTIVLIVAQCDPVAKLYDDTLPGSCPNRELNEHFAYFQGGEYHFDASRNKKLTAFGSVELVLRFGFGGISSIRRLEAPGCIAYQSRVVRLDGLRSHVRCAAAIIDSFKLTRHQRVRMLRCSHILPHFAQQNI